MKNGIVIILVLFLFSCNNNKTTENNKKNKETISVKKATKIKDETDLIFKVDAKNTISGLCVFGSTNLPDSTKLGASLIKNKSVFAQNFNIYVIGGKFNGSFGIKMKDVDEIEISCIANEFWQNKDILNQLSFIKTNRWEKEDMGRKFSYKINLIERRRKKMQTIIKPPINYKPITKVDGGIKDVSTNNTKRLTCNLDFNKDVSDEIVEKEIRYWINKIFDEHNDAKAIMIKCFKKGTSYSFKNGIFAPYGDWQRANENIAISEYKVRIY